MIRPLFTVAFAALAFGAVAELREVPVDEQSRAEFAEACHYYEMRAAAARQSRPGEFVVMLGDACSAADALIETGTPEQRRRSALLLWRISELRRTVDEMNGARAARASAGGNNGAYNFWTGFVPVSPSGEFLIAHRLGVLRAFDAWLDTGVPFSVASYP